LDWERYVEVTIDGITYRFRDDVYYSADGLWVAVNGELARVGVGDHLCRSISPSLNLIELRHPGSRIRQGEEMGNLDMVKVDIPIPSPVSGLIKEINEELESNLWLLDSDPYGEGWLVLFSLTDFTTDRQNLLDVNAYRTMLEATSKSSLADEC